MVKPKTLVGWYGKGLRLWWRCTDRVIWGSRGIFAT